jgi:hypothetical protein
LVRACIAEIGGDLTALSELDRLAISQTAALMLQIENMQAALVAGERIDPDAIIRTSSECRRSIGVLRAKAATSQPNNAYLFEKYGGDEPEEADNG